MRISLVLLVFVLWPHIPLLAQVHPAMISSPDPVPSGWTGPRFQLSRAFPATLPQEPQPWKQVDFKTASAQYMEAVIAYCLEGNIAVNFAGQNNAVRKWFHAPGMVRGNAAREFINGLTLERGINLRDLVPNAPTNPALESWAVGMYNPIGGYTLGRVWATPSSPDPSVALFADGAVSFKLLYTTATATQVPWLAGAPEVAVNRNRSTTITPATAPRMRLLQVDIAVRDDRANATTGWVFGTFVYRANPQIADPWKRLVPVGLMWGNDPTLLTQQAVSQAGGLKETWMNPNLTLPHAGFLGRCNGPVDNPRSSCLSCHGTASWPNPSLAPSANPSQAELARYFRNIPAGGRFGAPGSSPLDYSLQLAFGIRNFPGTLMPGGPTPAGTSLSPSVGHNITPRDGEARLDVEAALILSRIRRFGLRPR